MLLFEAKAEIDERLKMHDEYKEYIPEYFAALEIAVKCIEAQQRLADVLNELVMDSENDTYSIKLVCDILDEIRWDYEEDEEND